MKWMQLTGTAVLAISMSGVALAKKERSEVAVPVKAPARAPPTPVEEEKETAPPAPVAEEKAAVTGSDKSHAAGPTQTVRTSGSWMESHGQIPRIDVGGSFGYNNPAGMLGIETEYRLYEYLGIGLHGGIGGWGVRLSPVIHAYPFGASNFGLYGEAAFSLNLGGPASVSVNNVESQLDLGWNPAVNVSVGYRRQWLTYFWTSFKLGYQWKLGGNDDYRVTSGTAIPSESLNLIRPGAGILGGFVIGGSAGIAFL